MSLVFFFASLISILFSFTQNVGIVWFWSAKDIRFNIIIYECSRCSVTSNDLLQILCRLAYYSSFLIDWMNKTSHFEWLRCWCCCWMHAYYGREVLETLHFEVCLPNSWLNGCSEKKMSLCCCSNCIAEDEIKRNELSRKINWNIDERIRLFGYFSEFWEISQHCHLLEIDTELHQVIFVYTNYMKFLTSNCTHK